MLFLPASNLLDDLTLQADQCLERGDRVAAALYVDLIYELYDWANARCDTADQIVDADRELLAVGADE